MRDISYMRALAGFPHAKKSAKNFPIPLDKSRLVWYYYSALIQ